MLVKVSFKGHFRQHGSQICWWCDIFASGVGLVCMPMCQEVNTVSIGSVFHEVYEKKNPEKKIAQISDSFPR